MLWVLEPCSGVVEPNSWVQAPRSLVKVLGSGEALMASEAVLQLSSEGPETTD